MSKRNETELQKLRAMKVHPVLDLFPMMNGDDLDRLVWSIKKVGGLIHPVSLDEKTGRILDGRGRLLACEIADVEPTFAPTTTVARYVFAANIARRHLKYDQRVMIAALFEIMVEEGYEDDGFADHILSQNLHRRHLSSNQVRIADALVDEPDFPESLVNAEAKLVTRQHYLVEQVVAGTLGLIDAYQRVLELDRQAAERAEQAEALARLRIVAPVLALQVDDGALTSIKPWRRRMRTPSGSPTTPKPSARSASK
jgi:ParB-like chromosome segregation protein Spo0J